MNRRVLVPVLLLTMVVALSGGCGDERFRPTRIVSGGDASVGESKIRSYGCGTCHTIPGVEGADGLVGPPLLKFGRRQIIAGQLANTPDNLVGWITDPKGVEPGTAMPDLQVSKDDARDIAAYLEGLG
jgi:cytochrome c1